MRVLVSCWHCKRAVLMDQCMARRDLVLLRDHLADCLHDDPSHVLDDDEVLRHFRVVVIEEEQATNRTGPAPTTEASRVLRVPCLSV